MVRPRPHDRPLATATRFDACPSPDDVVRGVERIAAARPGLCRLSVVGTSRAGRPLHLLSVGHGPRPVLVVAGAHPDEAIGGTSLLALAEHLAGGGAETLPDVAWHLLVCLDPDGARINRPVPHPGSLADQYRGYFRPAVQEQPEWASSVPGGKPMPETRTLLDVIAQHRPVVQISLHSTDVGGSYAQLTRPLAGFTPAFAASAEAAGLPVETGALDAWRWPSGGPGVYLLPPAGTPERPTAFPENAHHSTWLAPHAYGGATAVVEVPAWASNRLADPAEHPDPDAALAEAAGLLRGLSAEVRPRLAAARDALPSAVTDAASRPLRTALDAMLQVSDPLADSWDPRHPEFTPMPGLTLAHAASLELFARRIPMRAAALLLHLLDRARRAGVRQAQASHDAVEQLIARRSGDYAASFAVRRVPVAAQAEHHVRCALALAEVSALV